MRLVDFLKKRVLLFPFAVSSLLILFFLGIPLITVLVKSFSKNKMALSPLSFSLDNYFTVFNDEIFLLAFKNSMLLLLYVPILMLLGLLMAVFLDEGFPFSEIYKTVIVFPQIISSVTIASIFSCVFGYNGAINSILALLNIPPLYWMGTRFTALAVVISCVVYSSFGWQTLLFSGGLSTIDPNIKSLMQIDGINLIQKMVVYANLLRPTLVLSLILNVLYGFSGFFTIIYTLTKGGPGYQTTTIDYLIYLRSFKYGSDQTSAYTIASILFFIVIAMIGLIYLLVRNNDA